MIRSSASFTFLKKSKSLHGEVSGPDEQTKSVNRPIYSYIDYMRKLLRNLHLT